MGRRSTDYHGDATGLATGIPRGVSGRSNLSNNSRALAGAAAATTSTPSQPTVTAASNFIREDGLPEGEGGQGGEDNPPSCWQSFCQRITVPSYIRQDKFKRIINNPLWRATVILFTITLLFGAQVRDIFFSKSADRVFDGIFVAVIGFFFVDMGMRIDVEPNYFVYPTCGRREDGLDISTGIRCANLQFGSFIFWCELVATLALFLELTWINDDEFGMQTIGIKLNSFGAPVRVIKPHDIQVMDKASSFFLYNSLNPL
jgi:hypothetical protein